MLLWFTVSDKNVSSSIWTREGEASSQEVGFIFQQQFVVIWWRCQQGLEEGTEETAQADEEDGKTRSLIFLAKLHTDLISFMNVNVLFVV